MTDYNELLAVADKAAPAYERWKQHGRIHGDDTLLYEYGKVATPHAVAAAIRSLQTELEAAQEKYRLLSAQHARLCDEVYEDDGETLKIVAERKAREEAERESKESEQLRYEENRRCCAEMDKRLAAESRLATVEEETIKKCARMWLSAEICETAIRAFNETVATQELSQPQDGINGRPHMPMPAPAAAPTEQAGEMAVRLANEAEAALNQAESWPTFFGWHARTARKVPPNHDWLAGAEALRLEGLVWCEKVCDQEGNEWDSDRLQTYKNYAHACRDRIRAEIGERAGMLREQK